MCGINASRGQGHGCRFTMCHASLKMTLLLHTEGLVKTALASTVEISYLTQWGRDLNIIQRQLQVSFRNVVLLQFDKFIDLGFQFPVGQALVQGPQVPWTL